MNKIVGYIRKGKFIPLQSKDNYSDIMPVFDTSIHGKYILQHSTILILKSIVSSLFGDGELVVEHTINGGLYCEIYSSVLISQNEVEKINKMLKDIINNDEELESKYKTKEELIELFKDNEKKRLLIEHSDIEGAYFTKFRDTVDFFHTPVVNSTSMLKDVHIVYYPPGIIIYNSEAHKKENQKKLFNIFNESEQWAKILHWEKVESLNKSINEKNINHFIHVAEALHERKIIDIANSINEKRGIIKLITIAGPSSSGKTTFLKRLQVQLSVLGISVLGISLDNYFVDREKTPLDENNKPDFESIHAVDLELFNRHLRELIDLKEVEIPIFDFTLGKRKPNGVKTKIDKNTIIIIEGIHGLNEQLTESIDNERKLKLYVSALTQINIDNTHRISTTDNRLIRRIVRDYLFRNHTAKQTFEMWQSVRRGEEKNIFPYQENADIMFNSSLLYEFSVLKNFAIPLLKDIEEDFPFYLDAKRLLFILSFFQSVSSEIIPHTSVLREFIGGSSFNY